MPPLLSFILVSFLFSRFRSSSRRLSSRTLDARGRSSLCVTFQDTLVSSLPVPRKPLVVGRPTSTAAYLPLHVATSLQSRVFSSLVVQRKMVGSINRIICMRRGWKKTSPSLSQPGVVLRLTNADHPRLIDPRIHRGKRNLAKTRGEKAGDSTRFRGTRLIIRIREN